MRVTGLFGRSLFLKRFLSLQGLPIVVETSNACNARCVWCWMYNCGRKSTGFMRFEDFVHFVDRNAKLLARNSMIPYHRGEALLHPRFLGMMEYASSRGCRFVDLATNLSCVIDVGRLLALPIPVYTVNVGGTTKEVHEKVMRRTHWELVVENLRGLYELNTRYGRRIRVKMNVTRHNVHQIKDLPDFVVQMGGRDSDAIVGTVGFTLPTLATKEEKAQFFLDVVSDHVKPYLRFTYDLSLEDFGIRAKRRFRPCDFLMPTVKFDGRVTICCHDQMDMLNLGSAFVKPLDDILRSSRYRWALLRGLFKTFDFCKDCS